VSAGRVPVIAGTGANATLASIEAQRHAKRVGADAGLVVAPITTSRLRTALRPIIKAIADAVALPIFVYNIPGRSIVDISVETMAEIARHPNIIGVKDATGDVQRVTQYRRAIGEDFIQLSGEDASALGYNAHGGHGAISVTSNVAPELCAQFQTACLEGRWDDARALNDKLQPLHEALFSAPSPAPAKYALSLLGLCEPRSACRWWNVPTTSKPRSAAPWKGAACYEQKGRRQGRRRGQPPGALRL
jgi:4-hydroxy-tetrahydrodipicolinate synthase